MFSPPRVVLLVQPNSGYDRGVLRGIARYARLNGPWGFFLAGDQPEVPMPSSRSNLSNSAKTNGGARSRRRSSPLDLRSLVATGVIGRLYDEQIAEAVLASGLPVEEIDLTDEQLSEDSPLSRLSEIRPDSHKAGILAAEHLLERGFQRFAFCTYPGENWSRWRKEGFCRRIEQAGSPATSFPRRGGRLAHRGTESNRPSRRGSPRCRNRWESWRATTVAAARSSRPVLPAGCTYPTTSPSWASTRTTYFPNFPGHHSPM